MHAKSDRHTERDHRPGGVHDARKWVPNAISATRFPLAVVFILAGSVASRLAVVAAAAFTDWVDGVLARRSGRTSRLGELLDPLADRAFVIAALMTLAVEGSIPSWTLPLLLLRDIGVSAGGLYLLARAHGVRMPARPPGKRVTLVQLVATAAILVEPSLAPALAGAVAVLGVVALRDYLGAARRAVVTGAAQAGFPVRTRGP